MRPVFMDEEIKLKFFHLADLHIGKRVNGFPMREDLEHIFAQIYAYAQKHQPDAVLIAGDVYDDISIPFVQNSLLYLSAKISAIKSLSSIGYFTPLIS